MAPNKRLQIARLLSFYTFIRFRMEKKEFNYQKFKFLRTQTFSHVIGCNIKFKTVAYKVQITGKFKI